MAKSKLKLCRNHFDLLLEEYKEQSKDWRLRDSYVEKKLSWVTAIFGLLIFAASGILITKKIILTEQFTEKAINYHGTVSALIGNEEVTDVFFLILFLLGCSYIHLVFFSILKDIGFRDGSETYLSAIIFALLNAKPTKFSNECQICKQLRKKSYAFKELKTLKEAEKEAEKLENPRKIRDNEFIVGSTFNRVICYYIFLFLLSLIASLITLEKLLRRLLINFMNKPINWLSLHFNYFLIFVIIVSIFILTLLSYETARSIFEYFRYYRKP